MKDAHPQAIIEKEQTNQHTIIGQILQICSYLKKLVAYELKL